jgi:CRP/FNR family transcriptional regulator
MQHSATQSPSAFVSVSPWLQTNESVLTSLGQTVSSTKERMLADHEHLYLEGDSQSHVYLVLSGVIGTYKVLADGRRQISTFAYPGDILGLDCSGVHVNNSESLGVSKVRCIPIYAIDKLIMSEPGFGQTLLRITATELADTRDQMLSLGRKSAAEKLATFLVGICRRNSYAGQSEDIIHIPMKRCDIADFLGLTVETVSRNFTKLKQLGVISLLSSSSIQINNREILELMADGDESVH